VSCCSIAANPALYLPFQKVRTVELKEVLISLALSPGVPPPQALSMVPDFAVASFDTSSGLRSVLRL